jgi:hypothetical protein
MIETINIAGSIDVDSLSREITDLCNKLRAKREPTWASVIGGAYCGGISKEANRNTLDVLRRFISASDVPERLGLSSHTLRLVSILESSIETA